MHNHRRQINVKTKESNKTQFQPIFVNSFFILMTRAFYFCIVLKLLRSNKLKELILLERIDPVIVVLWK